jgi:hypothetical protein
VYQITIDPHRNNVPMTDALVTGTVVPITCTSPERGGRVTGTHIPIEPLVTVSKDLTVSPGSGVSDVLVVQEPGGRNPGSMLYGALKREGMPTDYMNYAYCGRIAKKYGVDVVVAAFIGNSDKVLEARDPMSYLVAIVRGDKKKSHKESFDERTEHLRRLANEIANGNGSRAAGGVRI